MIRDRIEGLVKKVMYTSLRGARLTITLAPYLCRGLYIEGGFSGWRPRRRSRPKRPIRRLHVLRQGEVKKGFFGYATGSWVGIIT